MQVCVRLDDGECSDMFDVEQGLRQGCVLAPLLFTILFTAVLSVAAKGFIAVTATMDNNSNEIRRKDRRRGGRHGLSKPGGAEKKEEEEEEEVHTLWGMLYADDAGIKRNRQQDCGG